MPTAAALAGALTVALSSSTAQLDAEVRVDVSGIHARSALVVLHGGISRQGRWFHWVPLARNANGTWSALLKTPGFYGVYPLRVREDGSVRETTAVLSIVPPGFGGQPGFDTPTQVAQWWAFVARPGVVIRNVSLWRSGFYTHRDPTLNELIRVEFTLLADWPALHLRHGANVVYLSIARTRPAGPWRLLQLVRSP
jgi:hypothetical protein